MSIGMTLSAAVALVNYLVENMRVIQRSIVASGDQEPQRSERVSLRTAQEFRMTAVVVCLAWCAAMTGCMKSTDKWAKNRPQTVKASGVVMFNGEPLDEATVTLQPVSGAHAAFAQTDLEGRFALTTFDPGDGAVAGEYQVSVAKTELDYQPDPIDPDANPPIYQAERSLVPEKYTSPPTSGLNVTIPASGNANIELVLSGELGPRKVIIDQRTRR